MTISSSLYNSYRSTRKTLERLAFMRRVIHYTVEIKNTLLDSSDRDRAAVKRLYAAREDPFGFSRNLEQFRFQRAMDLLAPILPEAKFHRALEIGCAEGIFTRLLAERCESLLAVDLSDIAIERAQRACCDLPHVDFVEWDVRKDPIEGRYDLIVATGVLEYILRPSTLRDTVERISAALEPGGYLLLGNTVTETGSENTWIGKKLIRGRLVNDLFAHDRRYETIASSLDQCVCLFDHILLRKRPG